MTPAWAGAALRDLAALEMPADVVARVLAPTWAWSALPSDDQRRAVLKEALGWGAFYGLHGICSAGPPAPGVRPAEQRKRAARAAAELRAAAAALGQAPFHFRFVAEGEGITVERLRSAAQRIEAHLPAYPFPKGATVEYYVDSLAAAVKAATGRYHDELVAELVNAIIGDDTRTANAMKIGRRNARCQKSKN
jgi:hypothetical protein